MFSRRGFLGSAAVLAGAGAVSGRVQAAGIPEAPTSGTADDAAAARSHRAGRTISRW